MSQSSARHSGPPLPPSAFAGFAAGVVAVVSDDNGSVLPRLSTRSTAAADAVTQGVERIVQVQNVLSSTKDAETGQRGFLLTGDDAYLEPFISGRAALDGELEQLHALTAE